MRISSAKQLSSLSNEAARQAQHYRERSTEIHQMWFDIFQRSSAALAAGEALVIQGECTNPIPIIKLCAQQAERRNPGDGQ